MAFDRVNDVNELLKKTRNAWNEMRGHFMQNYEVAPTEAAKLERKRIEVLVTETNTSRTFDDSGLEIEIFYALYFFDVNEKVSFPSQLNLALKWALKQNKLDMVKVIVTQLEIESNLFEFVYGKPFSVSHVLWCGALDAAT